MAQDFYANDPSIQGLLAATQAVEPMTQEAVPSAAADYLAGLDFSGFSGITTSDPSLGGFGLGMTPGYVVPGGASKLITAPVSNKGNPTAYGGNNQFAMMPGHFVRLVDRNTNTVLFEGTGFEAAQKAVEMGQNLTDTMGRKADYQIETGNTQDNYQPVASEKFNKSTLGKVANVLGTVAPLATALIPGLNLGVLGSIGAGAGIGGASAALKGDDILKGAAMGGLSAAGGQLLGPALGDVGNMGLRAGTAIGTGLGSTAGGLVTGQSLEDALLGGVVSGGLSYITPDIAKGLGIGQGSTPSVSGGGGGAGFDGILVNATPSFVPSSIQFSGGSSSSQPKVQEPYDGINVTGNKFSNLAGTGNIYGAPTGPVSAFEQYFPESKQPVTEQPTEDEILVEARKSFLSPELLAGLAAAGGLAAAIPSGALKPAQTAGAQPSGNGGVLGTGLNIPQLLSVGGIGADLLKSLLAGGGTGAGTPYVSPFGPGAGIGAGRDMRANPDITDYERYGFGPEAMFFQPEYSLLASGGASPQAQSAMPTNSIYRPLI